jgi:hypothetical protein
MVSLMPVETIKTILEAYGMHDYCHGSRGTHKNILTEPDLSLRNHNLRNGESSFWNSDRKHDERAKLHQVLGLVMLHPYL